jgi:dTDP-4-amino-4,6-dideoxygalactose transaminase
MSEPRKIDLFRPYVNYHEAMKLIGQVLAADAWTGRVYLGQGPKVEDLETQLKAFTGSAQDVLTLNSCTSALDLSLHLVGLNNREAMDGQDTVVVTTPMTCTATNSPIVTRGGGIVWADVDPLTGLISPSSVAQILDQMEREPLAVMAVDWGGHLCDYKELRRVTDPYGVPIIQDAAHSFGTNVDGVPFMAAGSGRWRESAGDYVCFSFQAIKALTTGDGGALICPDEDETERARLLRWYGLDRRSSQDFRCKQDIQEVGYKYHMNDLSAALGLANLPQVPRLLRRQRYYANIYGAALRGLEGVIVPPSVATPGVRDEDSAWWLFTLLVSDRDGFIGYLAERGIDASPVHARNDGHMAFSEVELKSPPRPGVDFFAAHEVAIPAGWWLTEEDAARVCDAVWNWSQEHGEALEPPTPS